MKGEIQRQDDKKVYLQIRMGVIGVARDEIEKIEKTPGQTQKLEKEKQLDREETKADKKKEFEEKQIAKGLVKHKGRWITAEEKKRQELPRIKISNRRIYKGGKLFFIKGIAYSVNYPKMKEFKEIPLSTWEKDFQMLKKSGTNTIRTYAPLPPELLDLAEKYDLMVIETIVYPNSSTDYNSHGQRQQLINEAVRIVKRDKLRKCILMWSIWNDAPFHWESGGNVVERFGFEKVNKFLEEIYKAVKKEDKNHPVTAANMLDLPGDNLGFDFLDAIGCNAYIGIDKQKGWHRGVYTQSEARADVDKLVNVSKRYNKPVYIAETGYSTFCKGRRQDEIIGRQIRSSGNELSGIVIFEWADEWWKGGNPMVQDNHIEEHWGITDAYRKPKSGYQAVSELFQSIRTESRGYFK